MNFTKKIFARFNAVSRGGIVVAALSVCVAAGCSKESGPDDSGTPGSNQTVKLVPDRTSVIRNPLSGWVMYLGRSWDENFWTTAGYDNMQTSDGSTVRVSDYSTTAYLRTSWASLEPSEGEYVWRDKSSRYSRMLQSCLDRGLKLALRIVFDGRDQGQNTPMYVINAGAKYYEASNIKTPYMDDPVFQEKYAKFIEELAKDFNDPDKVDFIDAFSPGKWGEAHAVLYQDSRNKAAAFDWMTSLHARCFTKVPIFINYHRMIADSNQNSWSDVVPSDTEGLLLSAIEKGYSIRHDAFGMTDYYKAWEKGFASSWNFKRPVLMEGGWITDGTHRYWIDGSGNYREGHPEDVRKGEYDLSAEARVNMMDFRVNNEVKTWFGTAFNLVRDFVQKGGYRLYPDMVSVPSEAGAGARVSVSHRWVNLGWGYCPNNIPQWNYKYRVAFALLDGNGAVKQLFVDKDSDPAEWINGTPTSYKFEFPLTGVAAGTYTWAVGIVDTTRENAIGINLALRADQLTDGGWAKLTTLTVR